jgi:hypothetical protein
MFHRDVFADRRNIPASDGQRQANMWRFPANEPAVPSCSPNKKRSASMGLFTKDIKTTDDLFAHQLQDICDAGKPGGAG